MLLKRLGTRKVGNMFVQLRKIAQHPLLVRHLYSDDRVQELARLCHRRCAKPPPDGKLACMQLSQGHACHGLHQQGKLPGLLL